MEGMMAKGRPVFLKAAKVKEMAREAFLRGELPSELRRYSARCAIGVALTPRQMARMSMVDDIPIDSLIASGIVKTDDEDFLVKLQNANDGKNSRSLRKLLGVTGRT
jgi:hypothetical protein